MAFGYDSMPTKNYVFHCVGPRGEAAKPIIDQIWLGHRFQNALIAIERARREAVRAAAVAASPRLEADEALVLSLVADVARLEADLARERSVNRSKKAGSHLTDQLRAARAELKTARAAAKESRRLAYQTPEARELIDGIDAEFQSRATEARTAVVAGGLYWPTAGSVMTRVPKSGPPPRFVRWRGEGSIALQFQRKGAGDDKAPVLDKNWEPRLRNGKPVMRRVGSQPCGRDELFSGGNTMMRIRRLEVNGVPHPKRVMIDWRIGSEGKRPVWATIGPVVMHRPIPDGATVKWAYLHRNAIGTQYRWEVRFALAKAEWVHPREHERAVDGMVGVALGWSMVGDDLRIGCWRGSDGREGEIVIPRDRLGNWKIVDDLQSITDTLVNTVRNRLVAWRQAGDLPPEFRERLEHAHSWRSAYRVMGFVNWWRANRLGGDEAIFDELNGVILTDGSGKRSYDGGRRQIRHLTDWMAGAEHNARLWRKHFYREIAIELSRQYRHVAVAIIDWRKLAADPDPEDADKKVSKTNMGIAAVASLRDCLAEEMELVEVSAVGVAATCSACGSRCAVTRSRWQTCERCGGEQIDRGENAAKNILARGLVAVGEGEAARVQ